MSKAEATLALHLKAYKVPGVVEQHPFCEGRKYRFDFAFPALMLAVEVEGGAHGIKRQYQHDCERHNVALLLGWKVLRFTPADVDSGKAISAVLEILAGDIEKAKEVVQHRDGRPRTVLRLRPEGVAGVAGATRAQGRRVPANRKNV